jgi:hypothetical protein
LKQNITCDIKTKLKVNETYAKLILQTVKIYDLISLEKKNIA